MLQRSPTQRPAALLALAVAALASSCQLDIQDGAYACGAGQACPPGFSCGADGRCYRGPGDAGSLGDAGLDGGSDEDAGPREDSGPIDAGGDSGGDAGPFDAGPPCVAAGPDDGDGDGFCVGAYSPEDCDDENSEVSPGASELCDGPAERRDDDCDGLIDEGDCPFLVGFTHSPVAIHTPGAEPGGFFFAPELAPDGLRLYFTHFRTPGAIYVATRPDLASPFGEPDLVPVAGAGGAELNVALASITGDELEVVAQANVGGDRWRLFHASRASRSVAFGEMTLLADPAPGVSQLHPSFSRDGLEIFYMRHVATQTPQRLFVIRRTSRSAPFGAPEAVSAASAHDLRFPSLSEDGLMLVARPSGGMPTVVMRRASRSAPFGAPEVWTDAPPDDFGQRYFHSNAAGELWYTVEGATAASPVNVALFRAEVCRGDQCAAPTPIACPDDTATPDGTTCYHSTVAGAADEGERACGLWRAGALPATIFTQQEATALEGAAQAGYIGLVRGNPSESFAWSNGLPLLATRWNTGEPGARYNCGAVNFSALWNEVDCATSLPTICESREWPVFAAGR